MSELERFRALVAQSPHLQARLGAVELEDPDAAIRAIASIAAECGCRLSEAEIDRALVQQMTHSIRSSGEKAVRRTAPRAALPYRPRATVLGGGKGEPLLHLLSLLVEWLKANFGSEKSE